jgi:chromosome segregation ATPase
MEKCERKQEELKAAEQATMLPDETGAAKRKRLEELTVEAQNQDKMKREVEADLERVLEPQKVLERRLNTLQERSQKEAKNQLRQAIATLEQRREEIIAKESSAETDRAMRTRRLQESEAALGVAQSKTAELGEVVRESRRAVEKFEPDVEEAKKNRESLESKLNVAEQQLKGLQSSAGDHSAAIFGRRCTRVQQLVRPNLMQRCKVYCISLTFPTTSFYRSTKPLENVVSRAR